MQNTFTFSTAGRILFGVGVSRQLGELAGKFGRRVLLVSGRDAQASSQLEDELIRQGLAVRTARVHGEPTIASIMELAEAGRQSDAEVVIGFGGGSAIDSAKATAALLTNPGKLLDYLEVVGMGQPLQATPRPCLAVPTTAGTGAEVTRNAVIGVPERRVKVSLRSAEMLPRVALVDPALTYSLPPQETAFTGLDALTQLIEPFLSRKANAFTDAFCRSGLKGIGEALPVVYRDGGNKTARECMALASLMGGLALANAGLGAVHGFAGSLGGMFEAPHGALCARLLPEVLAVNWQAMHARQPEHPALMRYDEIAALLIGNPAAKAVDLLAWVEQLIVDLAIPGLRSYGFSQVEASALVEAAQRSSSMKGNPITLDEKELFEIIERALD